MGPFLIFLVICLQHELPANGLQSAAEATYIQSGMQDFVTAKERELIGKELRTYIGSGGLITKTIIEQRISFQWGF